MQTKYPTDPLQKTRTLYKQAQSEVNNNRLNRITEERMKKRFQYVAKQVQKKQANNNKTNIEQLIFYRNKFHSLMVLVGESMRQSYNKNRFENQVKNILNQNWNDNNTRIDNLNAQNNKSRQPIVNKREQTPKIHLTESYYQQPNKKQKEYIDGSNMNKTNQNKSMTNISPKYQKKQTSYVRQRKSKSPLEEFFQSNISKNPKKLTFQSLVPQAQRSNSQILADMKKMNKKPSNINYKQIKDNSQDSRIRDMKRQNQQLQKIVRKRHQDNGDNRDAKTTAQELQKQIYYFEKVNKQLKQQAGYPYENNKKLYSNSQQQYSIPYRRNNVNQISYKNLQYDTSKQKYVQLDRSLKRSPLKSNQSQSKINDGKSSKSNTSSIVQNQKQVYINRTPQVLFQNQLIKVMIIRHPLRIQEKMFASNEKLNPEDLSPNQERLELLVLNNTNGIVTNQELAIKVDYDYDRKNHQIESYRKPNRGYSKKAETLKDIVYSQIVKLKLVSVEGYNQQVKAQITADFFYNNSDIKRRKNRMEQIIDKKEDKLSIQVKIPVTFIQFSNKPFSQRQPNSKKTKLTIKPNPLYDTYQHTYMNTNLPLRKMRDSKSTKQQATIYGRSYIHNQKDKGSYLQSQITLYWSQKKDVKYLSIYAIQQWAYLLSYIFLDPSEQEEEFERQFRKPSMHVYFNVQDRKYA